MALPRRMLAGLLAVAAVALLGAASAPAQTVVRYDAQGRAINFEVLGSNVDLDWYTALLTRATHGDEISTVTIRIVDPHEIHGRCGAVAAACYSGPRDSARITVPAGRSKEIASTLLHEYGHHVDANWSISGVREPNGTPVWWALRGMGELARTGAVKREYSGLGWSRAIGEIFAEDYAYIHVGGEYAIRWLYAPNANLKKAMLAELRGIVTKAPPAANPFTMTKPVTIARSGTLDPVSQEEEGFRLLGPGRRITFTASVSPLFGSLTGARMLITCNGSVVKQAHIAAGRSVTLNVPKIGPANCSAVLSSTSSSSQRFSLKVRLAISPSVLQKR